MATVHPLDESTARGLVKAAFDATKADDVHVTVYAAHTGFTRWAVNEITTSGVVDDVEVSITCAVGNKHAAVRVHGVERARIADAARRAQALAELAPADPEYVADVGAARLQPVTHAWSDASAAASPDTRAQLIANSLTEVKRRQLIGAGFVQHRRLTEVVATRRGFFGVHHGTLAEMTTTARTPDGAGSGWASAGGVRPEQLDGARATRDACDKAERSHKPQPLDPGDYAVVLEPAAVGALMSFFRGAMAARRADEGRSCFSKAGGSNRVGDAMFGSFQLGSDPRSPLAPDAPFDDEGLPRPGITWIDGGVLKRLSYSRYWGKKTGHEPDARYSVLIGRGPRETPLPELVSGLERGLVVTRFWYLRVLEPQTLSVTGLTRDGVFLVENGKVVRPVNNFRFNQSVIAMFANADAYGTPTATIGENGETIVAPAVRCRKFHMASRSDAV